MCNNNIDCPDGDDERYCHFTCPPMCVCSGSVLRCPGPFVGNEVFGSLTRKLDLSSSNLTLLTDTSFHALHMLAVLIMSNCSISNFLWNVWELKNLIHFDLSHNNLTNIARDTFRGLHNLRYFDLSSNIYLTTIEIGAFGGLQQLKELRLDYTGIATLTPSLFLHLENLIYLNMSFSKLLYIEDGTFVKQTSLKILDLHKTKLKEFGKHIFDGLSDLQYLRTGIFTLCCPLVRPSSVDHANCIAPKDDFSSCEDLMQNGVLRVFVWILGMSALIGNICIITYRLCFDKSPLSKGCGYFILNLGFSDFFMGVYMTFVGGADMLYRGKYLWYGNTWMRSPWCKTAGFLSTLSSEASTMFICLVTLDRFLAIKFPFGQVRFNQRSYIGSCVFAWLLAILMALVPLLPVTSYWDLYGRNSVCLALPLSRDRTPGWEYSTSIFIGFNLLAFTFIAAAQVFIYKAMRGVSIVRDKKRLARERSVARKLTLVVVTDFICWFPVCIMGMFILFVPNMIWSANIILYLDISA